MTIAITIAAFLLSFAGIVVVNISARRSKAIRKNLVATAFKNGTNDDQNTADLLRFITALSDRQNELETEIRRIKQSLPFLNQSTEREEGVEAALIFFDPESDIPNDEKFIVWHNKQKKVIVQSSIALSSRVMEFKP